MKKFLTLALAIALLTAFAGLSAAQQQKGEQKSQPTGVEMKQTGGERKGPTQGEPSKCGTVTNVNHRAKTFNITATGKEVTFDASEMKILPSLGDTVVVTYRTGDPLKGLNVSKSKS